MLQQEKADDFVIATSKTHSVREFVELSFQEAGIHIAWKGSGLEEIGYDVATNLTRVAIDLAYYSPAIEQLIGDAQKAKKVLGWEPKISFEELVCEMVRADVAQAQQEIIVKAMQCKEQR